MNSRALRRLLLCAGFLAGLSAGALRGEGLGISSPDFVPGQSIPAKNAAAGQNIPPELRIANVPANAKSLALIVDDPDAPAGLWTHWVVWNLPAATTSLSAGALPPDARVGRNSSRHVRYDGPAPPSGTHRYFFHLYALDAVLDLPAGSDRAALLAAMKGHVVGQAEMFGTFRHGAESPDRRPRLMYNATPSPGRAAAADTYWLTRFVILRLLGAIYLVAFYVAAKQLVPLVGANGLTPAPLFFQRVGEHFGGTWAGFARLPSVFWFDCSDTSLQVVSWIGVVLSCVVLAGYANSLIMAVLWVLYLSIVHAGQDWYGYGWEIQMLETGFLAIFLCPLLDARPFPARPPPLPVLFLFRWLIVRIMLGSALIKLRGDPCWTNLTALYYHFETQPIPNPISRWFHFLPHPVLQFGVIWTFVVELGAPWFAFGPRWGRIMAGLLIVTFQLNLIVSGNLSFFNWLTILPALACFDDRFWRRLVPNYLTSCAMEASLAARPSPWMTGAGWAVAALVGVLSIMPVLNLLSPDQAMNTSYDRLHLVNTYGAFGTVGRERPVIIFEGSDSTDPATATDWKEYPYVGSPWDPARPPPFIAPYQPHLDWQLWFAAMAGPADYPWTLNLVWKLLHNDPATLSLFAGNPFPNHPPRYVRAVLYKYTFAQPGNPERLYWNRERLGDWIPPLAVDSPLLLGLLRQEGWLN